ncbi:hypothetical protein ABE137_12040 [Brevibacillus laterosporus]|uniref:hypothetical protein n=1 Tax=Brevibacillus phage Sundance TaxID=1691958 RepID=UPI0006BC8CC4|nr:hypothetical protein AVT09_gp076 [Brevibacillus phage Sundance]ALA47892.1 hypothetical protein SUNDANCE_76 [Brevibacillus phage Sundance]
MIIIEGKAGKSVALEKLINNQIKNTSIVILDIVNVPNCNFKEGVTHLIIENTSMESLVKIFEEAYQEHFIKYDWIAFEVNVNILDYNLNWFKELDRKYPQNFIITVQNDSLEEVQVKYA